MGEYEYSYIYVTSTRASGHKKLLRIPLNDVNQHFSCPLLIKHLRMIQVFEPQDIQPIPRPYPLFPTPRLMTPVICASQIRRNSFRVDDQIFPGQHYSHRVASYVLLPQDVLAPEKAPEERVRDTHVFGGEIMELVFIGVTRLAAGLE